MSFCDSAEFGFPVTVQNNPVDVATPRVGFVPVRLVVLKFTCAVEPTGLYGSSTAFTGRLPISARVMAAVIRSQAMSASSWYMSCAGIGAALAYEAVVEPLLCDALELAEEMDSLGSSPGSRHLV